MRGQVRRIRERVPAVVLTCGILLLLAPVGSIVAHAQENGGGAACNGPVIHEVRVEGLQRIEPATVKSYIQLRAGQCYDPAKVNQSLKSLFATGLFSDVSIRREGDVVIVKVAENPIINRIAFEGNDVIDDETLRNEVQLRPRVVYTRTRVQNDVKRIQDLYRRQGRFAVTVEPKVIQRSQNRVDLVFEIHEGPPTKVENIAFIGNHAFSDSRLRSVISSSEAHWYSFLTGGGVYDPDRLTYDQELLRRFYLEHGYADFAVQSVSAELSEDRTSFFITFTVDEGARYKFGDIKLKTELNKLNPEALRSSLEMQKGDWYSSKAVEESIDKLTKAVGDLGYAFVDVKPDIDRNRDKHTIDVTFDIREGPRVYVQRIEIHGNVRTEDRVIRREFELAEGDPFNQEKYQRSIQNIKDLGFFKKVDVKRIPGSAPDQTIIVVDVQEQSTGSLSIGAGVSTSEGLLSEVAISERNLLGKGQRLRLGASLGTSSQQIDLSFTEPYFLERNLSAGFDLFKVTREGRDTIAFDQSRLGGAIRLGFAYNDYLRQSVGYKLEQKKISNVDADASTFIKQQTGTSVTSALTQALTYDRRDSKIDPTEGYILSLSNDLAGFGGDTRYLRTEVGGTVYVPLISDWVGSLGVRGGYIFGIGKDIGIGDRFFIGGDNFRGFAVGGIGPRDAATGDALGGNHYVTGSAEVAIPFGNSTTYQTRGFVFSDFGTLGGIDASGPGIEEEDLIRVSLGVGLGVRTPFGIIRVNLAYPVREADFDENEIFSFRFGTGF